MKDQKSYLKTEKLSLCKIFPTQSDFDVQKHTKFKELTHLVKRATQEVVAWMEIK